MVMLSAIQHNPVLKANLLEYLKKAEAGNEIVVTSHGTSLATIVAPIDRNRLAKAKLKKLAKSSLVNDVVTPLEANWDARS